MHWKDIPQATRDGVYTVDVEWTSLGYTLDWYVRAYQLDLNPDFSRDHVWTSEQRVQYLEAKLEGRITHDVIRFNHPGWGGSFKGQMVCVDGLQRLTAAQMFMSDEVAIFGGHTFSQFDGRMPSHMTFKFNVNNLRTREQVLKWYIDLNAGGTPHSADEIARVTRLLEAAT